ncbi:MAG: ROK family protein [Anaerolineales bacterium]|nr:ROK family protein [Anaerolineales bacterium]
MSTLRIPVQPPPRPPLRVGVDVGGTKVAVLVAREDQELARKVNPTRLETPAQTLVGITDTIREAVALAGAEMGDVAAIGVGIPGRVDPTLGTVQMAVNLNWQDMAAGAAFEQALGVPCFLENDVRMAALGLKYHPAFAQVCDLAYFSVGTGIAAGIILNGTLHRGRHGMAGEIGHVSVVSDGVRCPCGATGCLETLAAGPAIERRMAHAWAQNSNDITSHTPHPYTTAEIFRMAEAGDPTARAVVLETGKYLGWAIKMLVFTYDLQLIVLGGGVSQAGTTFLDAILQDIHRQRDESELVRSLLAPEMIQLLPAGFDAPLWGGIALAESGLKIPIE